MTKMKKILIIEDDTSIAELMRDYLEVAGFQIDICGEGIMGLKSLKEKDYDLVLLDCMLPGIDGFEILRNIREEKVFPVLMVSAKKEEIDKIRGLGLGADDYITKPFSPGELVARVKSHIENYERIKNKLKGESKQNIIKILGMEIQIEARRVFINGKEVNLAQKEFDLLLYMAQNPNRVFSREELFERIWGYDALGDSATVTVHIGRIREKVESDPSNSQYIETVWGAGYRFKV